MGFIPVLLHLRTIFANMRRCKEDIVAWQILDAVFFPGPYLRRDIVIDRDMCLRTQKLGYTQVETLKPLMTLFVKTT